MNFSEKWRNEREPRLYVERGKLPRTQRQFFFWKYWDYIDRVVNPTPWMKTIELGCGRATITEYLARRTGVMRTMAVDTEVSALELVQKNLPWPQRQYLHKGDATKELPFEKDQFDLAISMGVAEHVDDVRGFFAEQYRLLKPGGRMVSLNIPHKGSIQKLNIFGHDHYHRTDMSADDYKRLAEEVGFSAIWVEHVNPYPLFTPIPKWAEFPITLLYLVADLVGYKFINSEKICQAHVLIARKE